MKLIVDIPEESYKYIKIASDSGWLTSPEYANAIKLTSSEYVNAIKNGTPLDSVKADVINIADGRQSIKVRSVLRILDRIGKESEGKE